MHSSDSICQLLLGYIALDAFVHINNSLTVVGVKLTNSYSNSISSSAL
jgi:hypothetical protein